MPKTNLSEALSLFHRQASYHIINSETIHEFWKRLIYLIKKREGDLKAFEALEQNQDRTIREVRKAFDQENPMILEELGALWNKILDQAGLEFDVKNASNPIQLTDNLRAYIKLKNNTNGQMAYKELSTGIRNFIFRLRHIYTLYFNQEVKNGILLVDEPETSLFPDFLYDLISYYLKIIHNTQFFVATHNPLIAA